MRSFLLTLTALSACANTPADSIERLQQQAWAEPWAMCSGDWEPKPSCSCRNRALWLMERLADSEPVALVGYRSDQPDVLHMVVAVDGFVLDYDGVHSLDEYLAQWEDASHWYDWRQHAARATGKSL